MNRVKHIIQASRVLRDWLGQGGQPVPLAQAQARADVCLQCPHNWQGAWDWRIMVAAAIASQEQLRATMGIHLAGEEKLNICDLCGCKLRLKVHVPFEHLYRHTPDEQFAKYPDFCWQKKEFNEHKTK